MYRMETLKRHLLFSGQEALQELKKFAIRVEEKNYRHQSGICLMRGLIITIFFRHEYTHAFMHVQMCV
jgi:hypothetical protein